MSMSIKDLGKRLYFAAVPLVFVLGTLTAIWLTLFIEAESNIRKISVPSFQYTPSERVKASDTAEHKRNYDSAGRDIFHIETTSVDQERTLELHEVALGMVIVQGDKRFCLTNGVLYAEGGSGRGFVVHRIVSNGVWYEVGPKKIFLQAGQKVNVDGEGNVRE